MMSIKILIAEDSASDRLIIRKMLSEYYILIACDGLEAMQLIQEHKDIDLLILDLNMPKMDGFEVLSELKTDNRYKKIRTIILTNYDELENEIKGLRFGAVDYVRKPIQMESLKARIDVHVELIKAQQALEYKIHEQGLTFDTVFNQAPVGIAISFSNDSIANEQNSHFSINPMYEKITGRTEEELKKIGWATITHPDDLEEDLRNYDKLKSGEIDSYSMEKRLIKKDGSIVWVYLIMASLDLSGDYHYNHIALLQDITTRKKIEADLIESERSKSVLLSHLPGLAYRCNYDTERTMQYVSDGCLELTGYSPESLLYNKELSFKEIVAPEFRESVWKKWHYCLISQSSFNYEYEIITARGERKWVLEMGEGIFNENSEIKALEGIIIDITDRKAMENILKYNNEHDSWTGLYNRNYLEELLIKDGKKQNTKKRALININMTAVQSLTMAYGFHYTQDLIKEIVDVLNTHCTDKRQLFYTYENQFVFYLKGYQYKKQLTDFCDEVANTLESLLAAERVRGGIGVVEIDQNNKNDVDQ
ncbi:MAG: PAS domain S-box protein, partial [Candidatus Caldatribacteriota bacterium]